MKSLKELKARQEEARQKAVALIEAAEKEGRFLTDDEKKKLDGFDAEIRAWKEQIIRIETFQEDEADKTKDKKDDTEDGGDEGDEEENSKFVKPNPKNDERSFRSFGEQMMAVYRASHPGAKLDARLSTRSASGLNESNASDGGFLVQKDFVAELLKRTYETGILASKVKKIPLSTNANGLKINAIDEESRANGSRWGGVQTFWESEADQISGSKPKFRTMDLSLKKLTGLCYATDELLQDASALESVIREAFAEEFGFKIDDAILSGTGTGQPLGILKSGALVKVEKDAGQTDKITPKNIMTMWTRISPRSKASAVWFINPEVELALFGLKDDDGNLLYIPAGGLSVAPYATLFGKPVIPLEQCSALGEVGDIILADLTQYLLIDKGGINATSSIHVRFLYDENVFRFIYRVDGQPVWNKALAPYKGNATVSPFVALAKRN